MYTIYTKPSCPACVQAKALLDSKGYAYVEMILDVGQEKAADKNYVTVDQLREKVPGAKTVPQILYNEELIGGLDSLRARL